MHYSKKVKAKNCILLYSHSLFLPCMLSSSSFFSFFFSFPLSLLHAFFFFFFVFFFLASFSLACYFSANDSLLSSVFRFIVLGCFMGFANWNFVNFFEFFFANLCVKCVQMGRKIEGQTHYSSGCDSCLL